MSSQPPKDFLALSHGHEWVNFYESFDKLVQDHLSRSSELLRKAMSLPEVADREVAQIRDDLETRINADREAHSATLTNLKAEIGKSHQQASALATLVSNLMGELDNLTASVDAAITQAAESAISAVKGDDTGGDASGDDSATAPAEEWVDAVSGQTAEFADGEGPSGETPEGGEDDSEIDLNALAAMEQGGGESSEDGTEANGSERPTPHWLTMSRTADDN
jgi:hypothetical protein